jgi:hypothetical protein
VTVLAEDAVCGADVKKVAQIGITLVRGDQMLKSIKAMLDLSQDIKDKIIGMVRKKKKK